jgi:transcriptional regulator NrdR family protein
MSQELEQATEETVVVTPIEKNPFSENSWVNDSNQPIAEEKVVAPTVESVVTEVPKVDYNQYLKEKFGFDSEEVALEAFKKVNEPKTVAEIKFENEQSEKFFNLLKEGKEDDVFKYLSDKKKIDRLLTSEITDTKIASEILKESFKAKYPDLSEDEIEYKLGKQFSVSEKPTQELDEYEEDFNKRMASWEKEKSLVEKEIIIEAKTVRRDLEGLKSNLVLPEINKPQQAENTQTQEELAALDNAYKAYVQGLESSYKSFNGITVTAKGEGVEIPVTFSPTDEDKSALKSVLVDFDQETYFSKRWIKDGGFDTQRIMNDIYLLENQEKAFQKVANDTLAKALEHYMKTTSNIKLNDERQAAPNLNPKSEMDKLAAIMFAS